MLANQQILDNSGQEATVAGDYAKCFGYVYDESGNGSYDPTDPASNIKPDEAGTIGSLLQSGDITRDTSGNVVDDKSKLCSPINLGPHNPTKGDLVFRWRLAMSYNNTLDQLAGVQNVSQ